MATANLLTVGTTETSSGSFTLAAGAVATLNLISATSPISLKADVAIEVQGSGGNWYPIGSLTAAVNAYGLDKPETYRVTRHATGASVGVDLTT